MSVIEINKELESLFSELTYTLSDLSILLREHSSPKTLDKSNEKLSEVLLIVERIKTSKVNYKRQIDSASSHVSALHSKLFLAYETKFDDLMRVVQQYTKQLNDLSTDNSLKDRLKNEPKSRKLITFGDSIQDKTQESINHMSKITHYTEKIGDEIMQDLEMQTDKLNKVKLDYSHVDSNINTAQLSVNAIAKGILRDKFVKFMLISILILTIACTSIFILTSSLSKTEKHIVVKEETKRNDRGPPPKT